MNVVPFPNPPDRAAVSRGARAADKVVSAMNQDNAAIRALAGEVSESLDEIESAIATLDTAQSRLAVLLSRCESLIAKTTDAAANPPHALAADADYSDPVSADAYATYLDALRATHDSAAAQRAAALDFLARVAAVGRTPMTLVTDHPPFLPPLRIPGEDDMP